MMGLQAVGGRAEMEGMAQDRGDRTRSRCPQGGWSSGAGGRLQTKHWSSRHRQTLGTRAGTTTNLIKNPGYYDLAICLADSATQKSGNAERILPDFGYSDRTHQHRLRNGALIPQKTARKQQNSSLEPDCLIQPSAGFIMRDRAAAAHNFAESNRTQSAIPHEFDPHEFGVMFCWGDVFDNECPGISLCAQAAGRASFRTGD
ncbi:hypothetical protein O77CONTIG1_04610 [Leptolyngbya sp. O-77]|nr:hypothetical protein O77CONTIG1_04610 [Leptolyngbya sp. O-77]